MGTQHVNRKCIELLAGDMHLPEHAALGTANAVVQVGHRPCGRVGGRGG